MNCIIIKSLNLLLILQKKNLLSKNINYSTIEYIIRYNDVINENIIELILSNFNYIPNKSLKDYSIQWNCIKFIHKFNVQLFFEHNDLILSLIDCNYDLAKYLLLNYNIITTNYINDILIQSNFNKKQKNELFQYINNNKTYLPNNYLINSNDYINMILYFIDTKEYISLEILLKYSKYYHLIKSHVFNIITHAYTKFCRNSGGCTKNCIIKLFGKYGLLNDNTFNLVINFKDYYHIKIHLNYGFKLNNKKIILLTTNSNKCISKNIYNLITKYYQYNDSNELFILLKNLFDSQILKFNSFQQLMKFWKHSVLKLKKIPSKFLIFLFDRKYTKIICFPEYFNLIDQIICKLDNYNAVINSDLLINHIIMGDLNLIQKNQIIQYLLKFIPNIIFNSKSLYLAINNNINSSLIKQMKKKILNDNNLFNINIMSQNNSQKYPLIEMILISHDIESIFYMIDELNYDPFIIDDLGITPFYYIIIQSNYMLNYNMINKINKDLTTYILTNYEHHKFTKTFNLLYNTHNIKIFKDTPSYINIPPHQYSSYITNKMLLFIKNGYDPFKINKYNFGPNSIQIYRNLQTSILFTKFLMKSNFSKSNLYDKNLSKIIIKLILNIN
jgi:hypothetical protein